MKKTATRFKLKRETILHLEPKELWRMAGGVGTAFPTACDAASGCFPSCIPPTLTCTPTRCLTCAC